MKRAWFFIAAFTLAVPMVRAADTANTTLKIEGMTCAGCVPVVRLQLKSTEGVIAFDVSFEKAEAEVSYDPTKTTPARIAESIAKTGYRTSVKSAGHADSRPTSAPSHPPGDSLDRVTLFQVPLMCSAVKGLGCGGKARPLMAQLEKHADIAEAWLNHPGTVLAVVWKQPQQHAHAADVIGSVFVAKGMQLTPLRGAALVEAVRDFATRKQWYRGDEVNRLSEEEAKVMAERIVRRVETRVGLSPKQAAALRADVNRICADMLLRGGAREMKVFVESAAAYLNARQVAALETAIADGFGALPGELGS